MNDKELVDKMCRKENEIKIFHIIVQWIKEMDIESNLNVTDFDVIKAFGSVSDRWDKISLMFRGMGYSSHRYSADNCRQIFCIWSQFYAENYDKLNTNLETKAKEIFDLMKIIHILDSTTFWTSNDWTLDSLEDIANRDEIKDYLNDVDNHKFELPNKIKNKRIGSQSEAKPEDRYLSAAVRELVNGEDDIKLFHSMVKMIEPNGVYWKNAFKRWEEFSKNLKSFGYPSEMANRCKGLFYKWTQFYAQNYYKLNDDLDPELQEVFDLLKIVHTLDSNKMWRSDDPTLIKLEAISSENEIKEYLEVYKKKGYNGNEEEIILSKKELNGLCETNFNEVVSTFEAMQLRKQLLKGIKTYGLEKPSFIQQRAILPCARGRNVMAQAQSGMGKTATFVIAILQRIDTSLDECQALILTPTRELAQQIQKVVSDLGQYMRINCQLCIGGTDVDEDVHKLRMGAQIMVGTSGRICDMIERRALRPETIKIFVVDEADHMLQSGKHRQQFNDVYNTLSPKTQVILMSATMPKETLALTKTFMKNQIRILVNDQELTLEGIKQYFVKTECEEFKFSAFCDLYSTFCKTQAFVYCNTREKVDWLTQQLEGIGLNATHIHGDMEQKDRNSILRGFRAGFCRVLLTSDLLGRGIDVQQVSLVVNYDLPTDRNQYIHRVGRGGRFGRKGCAISFVTDFQVEDLNRIEMFYNTNIEELPTNFDII